MGPNEIIKMAKIFSKLNLKVLAEELEKKKVYYTLQSKDNDSLIKINFSLTSIQQSASKSIEKQIAKKLNK